MQPVQTSSIMHSHFSEMAAASDAARRYSSSSASQSEAPEPQRELSRSPAAKPRALVVDDAPDVTEMIAIFLQQAGYETTLAFCAEEALNAAHAEHFDVVISDIGMPQMNGYQLAEALRAMPDYHQVPLIAVTGFSMYDDKGRAAASGFNAQLTKPINPAMLLEVVERLRSAPQE